METAILAIGDHTTPTARSTEFRELYDSHSESVYLTALRVTGNPADAEDVLQTVFLKLLDRDLSLDTAWAPGAYLRRSAANAAIDVLRRKKSRRETDIDEGGETPRLLRAVTDEAREEKFAMQERLRAAMGSLSAENAELFVLCYIEGYSYDELAEMLQIERGTVGSRLNRIKAALQKELSQETRSTS